MELKEIKANILLQIANQNLATLVDNLAQAYADLGEAKKKIEDLEANL